MRKWLSALFFVGACASIPVPSPIGPVPSPIVGPPPSIHLPFDLVGCSTIPADNYCAGPANVTFRLNSGPNTFIVNHGDANGYTLFQDVSSTIHNTYILIDAPGYNEYTLNTTVEQLLAENAIDCDGSPCHNMVQLVPTFPAPPTRDQVLNVHITGQGLTVHTQQFGDLPWWEAVTPYLNTADRLTAYAAKHASTAWPGGDTHTIIGVPSGPPLYDEPNQPYSPDRFGPLDWTQGGTGMIPAFDELVIEQVQNGFVPLVFMYEDYTHSIRDLPLVIAALQHSRVGDLTPYVVLLPGWDGVFYGWGTQGLITIPGWAATARALCPNCYLGIEDSTGHIPLGEGDGDWVRGGRMQGFDLLLKEYDDNRFDDSVWQIDARTLGPAYRRPPEQPAADDPDAPFGPNAGQFYLREGNPRGRFYACAFEFSMYGWVRSAWTAAQVQAFRQYFLKTGNTCGG